MKKCKSTGNPRSRVLPEKETDVTIAPDLRRRLSVRIAPGSSVGRSGRTVSAHGCHGETTGAGRREFLLRTLMLIPAAVTLPSLLQSNTVMAQGSNADQPAKQESGEIRGDCSATGTSSESLWHTHDVECITMMQLKAGVELELELIGGLSHTVILSPSQLGEIVAGKKVSVESDTTFFHTHVVTFEATPA